MAGELLRELEPCELVGRDDAVHDARVLEQHQVSVHGALGEAVAGGEDLGDRQRSWCRGKDLDDRGALRSEPLTHAPQPRVGLVVKIRRHGPSVPSSVMDATERFTALVQRADGEIPLDEAALLIAAHDHHVDVKVELERLDALAHEAPMGADALVAYLFSELGFAGNAVDYGDPRNSYLDEVVRRRLGLPITLSLLVIEVGRRRDLALEGVGMPGHFLVRADAATFYDPFHGGERLDEDGCRRVFARAQPDATFQDRYLAPIGARAILARMLANLVHTFVQREPSSAVWALRLRLRVPGVPPAERRDAAALLGTLGSFEEAATELDSLTDELDGEAATRAERDAAALRARAN